ncbi:MAG: hypothetical protein FWB95_02660 [Treponema sp.]|nr:hypothetical protein [Treponema sp.]
MNETIKELLKPPFVRSRGKTDGVDVCMKKSHKHRGNRKVPVRLFNIVRDNLCWLFWDNDGAKIYNEIIDWVVNALNEKYIRDFGVIEKHECDNCEYWDAEKLSCNDKYTNPCPTTVTKRWQGNGSETMGYYITCPKCNEEPPGNWDREEFSDDDFPNYCPNCGTKLLPPEEK